MRHLLRREGIGLFLPAALLLSQLQYARRVFIAPLLGRGRLPESGS